MSRFYRRLFFLMGFMFLPTTLLAENLGVVAHVYPIAEPNMLDVIHQKLQALLVTGQLKRLEQQVTARVRAHVLRPPAVSEVSSNTVVKTVYYTPQVTLKHTLYDNQGRILFFAGTKVNALDAKSVHHLLPNAVIPPFNEVLIFINADRPAEVRFAQHAVRTIQKKTPARLIKIILVKGNLATASNALGRIYFDQSGRLCRKLKITGTPAVVTRDGIRLKISEVVV